MPHLAQKDFILILIFLSLLTCCTIWVVDFVRHSCKYDVCPKRRAQGVQDCWACYGVEDCKNPFRQICSDKNADDTREKALKHWNEDDGLLVTTLKPYPKDSSGKFIILDRSHFKCISLATDYYFLNKTHELQVQMKGCVHAEYESRHSFYKRHVGKDAIYGKGEHRYTCTADLCNKAWNIRDVDRPRKRRLFEGPVPQMNSHPRQLWYS